MHTRVWLEQSDKNDSYVKLCMAIGQRCLHVAIIRCFVVVTATYPTLLVVFVAELAELVLSISPSFIQALAIRLLQSPIILLLAKQADDH